MSIYATLWELKFPLYGQSHTDCEWETVRAQGVPDHIGEEGDADYLAFLPPRRGSIENGLRAVIFVRALQEKGTDRSTQEYPNPLLVLTGNEYSAVSFSALHGRLIDALRGSRPRVVAELHDPNGTVKVLFENGSSQFIRGDGET